ncbi:MAG: hypothetical protein GOP50_04265 [Candidatus Heimdallarchaeota archaeon]|nr:hypothetical protein [Candidatus Heimdallarchaeota archaeon]
MIMNDFTFRRASNSENELVKKHIQEKFGSKTIQIFSHKQIWIKEGRIKEVFLVREKLENILDKLSEWIYSMGIPIGSLCEDMFQLEIEGSYLILPYTSNIIKVKTNQFLYGKPIFVENVDSFTSDFNKGDHLIIIGNNDIHYGVGKAEIGAREANSAQPNTILVKGLQNKPLDRGWYLRKGN